MAFGKAYLIRPPRAYRWVFADAVFRKDETEKKVYLTFDDGPHIEATSVALRVLEEHGIKATFFVLGTNAQKHPELVEMIRSKGHQIGNHGMEHVNGWSTNSEAFIKDALAGKSITDSNLFRPPYGKLKLSQYWGLKKSEKIIFWDVISGDFDTTIDANTVVRNVIDNVRNGSIIVMHDSQKALKNMEGSLSTIIQELKKMGYQFGTL